MGFAYVLNLQFLELLRKDLAYQIDLVNLQQKRFMSLTTKQHTFSSKTVFKCALPFLDLP
jgi:hypothetical protein